jgi:spermidine synthase
LNLEGKHVIIDAFECDREFLNNKAYLEPLLLQVAKDTGMKVLHIYFHPFHPKGVTGMMVLATSHISIHTWPEEGYAAFDIYTCGEQDPIDQVESILKGIFSKRATIYHIARGVTKQGYFQEFQWAHPSTLSSREDGSGEANFENISDIIGLKEILNGEHRNVFNGKSEFQTIQVVEAPDLRMYLNGQLQFSSIDERIYHEALVHPALTLADSHEQILILGGGDGLALREILKYSDVKQVTLVDLDPLVVDAAKYVPTLASLNQYSLHDSRVTIHPQDAAAFLASNHSPYDVIIVDLPDPTSRIISDLYTIEFYSQLEHSLTDDGVFVSQANSLDQTPIVFWSIRKTIESAGFQTLSYHTNIPSFGDWGFHIGSKKSILWGDKKVQVPQRTLPSKLQNLAYFPPLMLVKKNSAIVNSKKHSILHKL